MIISITNILRCRKLPDIWYLQQYTSFVGSIDKSYRDSGDHSTWVILEIVWSMVYEKETTTSFWSCGSPVMSHAPLNQKCTIPKVGDSFCVHSIVFEGYIRKEGRSTRKSETFIFIFQFFGKISRILGLDFTLL